MIPKWFIVVPLNEQGIETAKTSESESVRKSRETLLSISDKQIKVKRLRM